MTLYFPIETGMGTVPKMVKKNHWLTIHARNMMRPAFLRSQLEASKIGQKVKKKSKKPFSTSIFKVLSNLYRLSPS